MRPNPLSLCCCIIHPTPSTPVQQVDSEGFVQQMLEHPLYKKLMTCYHEEHIVAQKYGQQLEQVREELRVETRRCQTMQEKIEVLKGLGQGLRGNCVAGKQCRLGLPVVCLSCAARSRDCVAFCVFVEGDLLSALHPLQSWKPIHLLIGAGTTPPCDLLPYTPDDYDYDGQGRPRKLHSDDGLTRL